MHYKNGTEAKDGDAVILKNSHGKIDAGTLHSLNAGCTTCNGQVAIAVPGGFKNEYVTIGEIYSAADAFQAMTPMEGVGPASPEPAASPVDLAAPLAT